jgi:hypothetical protein
MTYRCSICGIPMVIDDEDKPTCEYHGDVEAVPEPEPEAPPPEPEP